MTAKCGSLRLSCDMATNTYIALKKTVRTTRKSMPTIYLAWLLRNVSHRCCLELSSSLCLIIYFATVLSQTSKPSFLSSPWMRWADHIAFSILQLSYKLDQFPVNRRPADSWGFPHPVRLKASFMPANNGRGLDDNQRRFSVAPDS